MKRRKSPRTSVAAWLTLLSLLGWVLSGAGPASAQAQVKLSETKLTFQGLLSDSLQRTFTLTVQGDPVSNLTVVRRDLPDAEAGTVILSRQITVEPLTVSQVTAAQDFTVTIAGVTKPGHYVGNLELRYDGRPLDKPLTVELDVTLGAAPAVDTDVSSKTVTFAVSKPWTEAPYVGRPRTGDAAPVLGEQSIFLLQKAEGQADVLDATVLRLATKEGKTLPAEVVRADATLPLTVSSDSDTNLRLVLAGWNLPAGLYNGTLRVRVRNQAAPLEVPVTVQIKHGFLLPLVALLGGMLLAGLLSWWNSEGKRLQDLGKAIEELAADIQSGGKLQAHEIDRAMPLLEEARVAFNAGKAYETVKALYDQAQAFVNEARAAADKLLSDTLAPLVQKVGGLKAGRRLQQRFLSDLEAVRSKVNAGEYSQLVEAQNDLQGIASSVDDMANLVAKLESVPPEQRKGVADELDKATTRVKVVQILKAAGVQITPEEEAKGATLSYGLPVRAAISATWARVGFARILQRKWYLRAGQVVVTAFIYIFTLAVGFITLYVAAPTFGADPKDYISLILWGSVVESLRGQTVTFTTLQTLVTQKVGQPGEK